MMFTKSGAEIFRDFTTPGVPSSGAWNPDKADIRTWMAEVEGRLALPPGFVSVRYASAADADHDVVFSPGRCRADADDSDIVLAAAITKQIDAAWAVGNDQGGLDTGSVQAGTFYYLWIIQRSDTGLVDALFSASATAPTMPTNYDRKQRVGWVLTDGSANIRGFRQSPNDLDEVRYTSHFKDVDVSDFGSVSGTLYALSVPPEADALFRAFVVDPSAGVYAAFYVLFSAPFEPDDAAELGFASLAIIGGSFYNVQHAAGEFRVPTNSSSEIRVRADEAPGDISLYITTKGAVWKRGIVP